MSTEIELKLLIAHSAMASVEKALLSQSNVQEQNTLFLGNTYYDTADRFFAQNKMGLRVRKENQQFTLTLKTEGRTMGACIFALNIICRSKMKRQIWRN